MSSNTEVKVWNKIEKEAALVKEAMARDVNKVQSAAKKMQTQTVALVKDPQFQTCTLMTSCGAITVGSVGGAFGLLTGIVSGGAAGVIPSLLTFGLSIPAGAAMGGGAGLCAGTVVGSSAGGLAGYGVYKYRVEIKNGMVYIKVKSLETSECVKLKVSAAVLATKSSICNTASLAKDNTVAAALAVQTKLSAAKSMAWSRIGEVVDVTAAKAGELATFATTTRAGVTSTSALAGGAVGGTTGGVAGAVAGAAVGLIPAVFTFGLSIPVFATVGLCAGTAVGGAAGTLGGGAAGYGGFTYRKEIKDSAQSAWFRVATSADHLKSKASEKAMHVKATAKALVISGTGGTETAASC